METKIVGFLASGAKSSLEICSQFGLTVVQTITIMKALKRNGIVWQRNRRTMGRRNVSWWGLAEQ